MRTNDISQIAKSKLFGRHGNCTKSPKICVTINKYNEIFDDFDNSRKTVRVTEDILAQNNQIGNVTVRKLFKDAYAYGEYDCEKLLDIYNEHYSRTFSLSDEPWFEKLYTTSDAQYLFYLSTGLSTRKFDAAVALGIVPRIRYNSHNCRYRKSDLINFFTLVETKKVNL